MEDTRIVVVWVEGVGRGEGGEKEEEEEEIDIGLAILACVESVVASGGFFLSEFPTTSSSLLRPPGPSSVGSSPPSVKFPSNQIFPPSLLTTMSSEAMSVS